MPQETESIKTKVYYTKRVRFWSNKELASSAYDRIEELRSNKRNKEAALILSEWLLKP